jgi:hypothetical protein
VTVTSLVRTLFPVFLALESRVEENMQVACCYPHIGETNY